jgi:ABC-2 type transport system ATP-binding protein
MSAISVDALTKRFGEFAAVDEISFEIPAGQLVAVLGPNGAGKTTTLEMLEGFLAPTSGTIRVLGTDPRHGDRSWRARIGLVLQSTSLDAELTVHATLALYAALYPRAYRVQEVLELVDLTADADTKVGALSGGQRRRVDLAIGIIGRPEVLFLDEPTTGLDPEARRRTWGGVENLTATGTTVMLTTHYVDEADHLADRVIVLSGGRIISDTTPRELRAHGGPAVIRCPVPTPALASSLPPGLDGSLEQHGQILLIRSQGEMTGTLRQLASWAEHHQLDLSGLEIGPPSLEDAYLNAIGEPLVPEVPTHA